MKIDGCGEQRCTDVDGNTYWLDDDGERWYEQPKDWSLDKDPADMNEKELAAAVARDVLGCDVKWWPYYKDWTCSCGGGKHAIDSQCSVIADYNVDVRHARNVARAVKHLRKFDVLAEPRAICEAALQAVREEKA